MELEDVFSFEDEPEATLEEEDEDFWRQWDHETQITCSEVAAMKT